MRTILAAAALSAAIAWGDTMPVATLVELPRDAWITIHTAGGHRLEGILVESDAERVIIDGDRRHFIRAAAIEAVSTEKR